MQKRRGKRARRAAKSKRKIGFVYQPVNLTMADGGQKRKNALKDWSRYHFSPDN